MADVPPLRLMTQTGHGARIQIDPGQWSRQVDAFELKLL